MIRTLFGSKQDQKEHRNPNRNQYQDQVLPKPPPMDQVLPEAQHEEQILRKPSARIYRTVISR
ncbi:hypothetical protein H2204_002513 [Knufia peltigerae]|uniref:Uncharacterized protein n=1 Tax=Knufia peltigerae TaxID=1002370 RepID=A0AA38YAW4_9EURO|nr:hypothetical protein H2204_002513 [Knufia peltigerae]